MDIELALIAEHLRVRVPYLRGEKNERRMAHEFMQRFVADGKICFQRKNGAQYILFEEAIESFETADKLLVAWSNRASHTFDLVQSEAQKLIDACEQALEVFKCTACKKRVWFANAQNSGWVQCHCGEIHWRYAKG